MTGINPNSTMDRNGCIFPQCQVEACNATVLLGGPYCDRHKPVKGLSKPTITTAPPGQRQPNSQTPKSSSSQSSSQSLPLSSRNPIGMDPIEKTGDAITVKTPLAVLGSTIEKKQLPGGKAVARKTTNSTLSKQPIATTTRNQDPKPPVNRNSTSEMASLENRPFKRLRLNIEASMNDRGARPGVPVFTSSTPEDEITAAAGFFLHPRKQQPASFEAPPGHRQRGEQNHIAKPTNRDPPRKLPIPAHNVIDLTGDDPEPEPYRPKNSYSNGQRGRDGSSGGTNNQTKEKAAKTQYEEKSIEVQVIPNPVRNFAGPAHTAVQSGPQLPRNTVPSAVPNNPTKPASLNIAPRPNPTMLPSNGEPTLISDKQMAPKYSPSYSVKPPDPPRQNGKQVRNDLLTNTAGVAGVAGGTNHIAANHGLASTGPPSASAPSTSSANGGCSQSRVAESKPSSEQVRAFIQEVLQRSKSRGADFYASLPQPDSFKRATPLHPPQRKDSDSPKLPAPQEQKPINSYSSIHRFHGQQKPTQPLPREFQHVGEVNGKGKVADTPIGKSSLASMFPKRSWKSLNPEERRQVYKAQHDPAKFDSYIYGKLNEPNRPGSALFGLPEYLQPPRPTRPATHFAHIDPRIHWTHPRSKEWYRQKQDEIRERGTRKSNFGRAAASAARRRQKEEEDGVGVDLPERVKSNPAWLAAIDELDEMADRYHARQREKARYGVSGQKGKERSTVDDSDNEMDEGVSPS